YLVCTGDGMPIMWCLANPKIGEREVVAALLEHNHHLLRSGQILLADKSFAGREFKHLTDAMGLRLLRPDRKDETYRNGDLGGVRQWIESVNQTLKGQLDLEDHGGRTLAGVFTRVAQRLLAMAAGIWHNWTTGVTSKRSLTAYDH
ncbi:MAG: IS982 family transposase, partial [Pseudonocardiaceae bacterium]